MTKISELLTQVSGQKVKVLYESGKPIGTGRVSYDGNGILYLNSREPPIEMPISAVKDVCPPFNGFNNVLVFIDENYQPSEEQQ